MRRDEFGFDPEERAWLSRRVSQIMTADANRAEPPVDRKEEDVRPQDN